jgi:hypothetical protein
MRRQSGSGNTGRAKRNQGHFKLEFDDRIMGDRMIFLEDGAGISMKGAMADTQSRWSMPRPEGNRFRHPELIHEKWWFEENRGTPIRGEDPCPHGRDDHATLAFVSHTLFCRSVFFEASQISRAGVPRGNGACPCRRGSAIWFRGERLQPPFGKSRYQPGFQPLVFFRSWI